MAEKKSIDLSIIIVHFNTPSLLKQCIDSIMQFAKKTNLEIIIVDNASTDGKELLKDLEKKSAIQVLYNKKNLGFSLGNNEGIKVAKGKYVLLLNSDTIIKTRVLDSMVDWMEDHSTIGVATVALQSQDGRLQSPGGFFPSITRIFYWMFFVDDLIFLKLKPYHVRPDFSGVELDWITGAFFLIRKEIIAQVGLLDADYFMYVEDMDYCYRIKKAGWKVGYNAHEFIIHLGGASSTKEFPLISEFRGVLKFYKKHKPAWQYLIVRSLFKIGSLLRIGILGILRGPAIAKIYAKAFQSI